jgi:hypothetical protein
MLKRKRSSVSGMSARDPLDSQIAVRVFGFRWVEWNHALLRGALLDKPGRFLASPDDVLAHLHVHAAPGTEPAPDALNLVPRYTTDLNQAFDVAGKVGLFGDGHAILRRTADGDWCIETASGGLCVDGPLLASIVCRAAIAWLDRSNAAESAEPGRT